MLKVLKQIALLASVFLILQAVVPEGTPERLTATASDAPLQTAVTYQKGDGKGDISETDDGTLSSKFIEESQSRSGEYQGEGSENSLLLKRVAETSNGQTTVETKRIIIKFPNIIGDRPGQIPRNAQINSAILKLVINTFNSPIPLSASVYRVLENWTETESGYLKSPSWRKRIPAVSESDTATQWTNFGADTPISSESPPVAEAIQIPNILGDAVSFDITAAVKAWADGKPNNGVMLKLSQESPAGTLRLAGFYSSEWPEMKLRPLLEVTYTTEATTPPPTTAVPQPTTACGQETKLCPDGTYVGRTAPGCEFAQCPAVVAAPAPAPAPAPVPAPKLTPTKPAPKSTPTSTPAPAPTPVPTPFAAPAPQEPEKPSPIPAPAQESKKRPKNVITSAFAIIQSRILETWESIVKFFR